MNAFPVPVSGSAFSLRLEPSLAKPEGSTTYTKKRPEKAFVLFLNKSIKQTVDAINYVLSIFKRSVFFFETRTLSNTIHKNKLKMD